MSPARQADPELDNLIYEITVDSRDEDEQLTGFEASFDEDASFPCPGTVVGEEVQILSVSRHPGNEPDANTTSRCSTSTSTPTQPPHAYSPHTAAG